MDTLGRLRSTRLLMISSRMNVKLANDHDGLSVWMKMFGDVQNATHGSTLSELPNEHNDRNTRSDKRQRDI